MATEGAGAAETDLVWIAVPRQVLIRAAGAAAAPVVAQAVATAGSSTSAVAALAAPAGRYAGADGTEARIEIRIDENVASGDLFHSRDGAEKWSASFRTAPGVRPALDAPLPVIAEDRLGTRSEGTLLLRPDLGDLSLSLTFAAKLDILPVGQPIRALMRPGGPGYRDLSIEIQIEPDLIGSSGITEIPPSITHKQRDYGLEEALADAGIRATVERVERTDLRPPPGKPWDESKLHTLMEDFARADREPRFAMRLFWLSTASKGDLHGVMFDGYDGMHRQAAAIFSRSISREVREKVSGSRNLDESERNKLIIERTQLKLNQIAVHEIGHALNLIHPFERENGNAASLSFMNYDWKHPGKADGFWRDFDFRFDPDELAFLRHAPFRAVAPGGNAFGSLGDWIPQHGGYTPFARSAEPGIALDLLLPDDGQVFAFGQPVLLGLRFTNGTATPLSLPPGFLDPKAGTLGILVERESAGGAGAAAAFRPMTHRCCVESAEPLVIPPGGMVEDNLNLTFGATGFAFAEPGNYRITAVLDLQETGGPAVLRSAPLRIRILTPRDREEDAAALSIFEPRAGTVLALGGTEAYSEAVESLLDVAERLSHARRKRRRTHPVATGIYRALSFHYQRDYTRYRNGRFEISSAQPEMAARCSDHLKPGALKCLDPVSRRGTEAFLRSLTAPEQDTESKAEN